ncbi:Integral membrane protein TerC [Vibrio fluvialis PG41]|uniref:Integral membrane protein TerC n=1 Tax=Vibrio fluvialis PG41 TaxID=1336752 RepID=S7HVH5_VIBFL|nr:TerC/Alx family metal homeostasis membrane protein [Vibrio fluvialis]EPP19729.1 Integral membrane protein TerC [Vibrio fluvialis PG41]
MELAPLGFPLELITVLGIAVIASVALDLWGHRNSTEISVKDAGIWSVFWVGLALAFYGFLYVEYGKDYASLFLSGYALEKTLSVDNLMVFVAVFSAFGIKDSVLKHRILYWGIIGALVFRAIFIAAGSMLYSMGNWVELVFAAFILYAAYVMVFRDEDDEDIDYEQHKAVRLVKKFFPVIPMLHGKSLFVNHETFEKLKETNPSLSGIKKAAYYATPAFLCLTVIELTDVAFSFDSVPAIIAITEDPILVYSAVIFAILGLRNLFFLLQAAVDKLSKLEAWVGLILLFIAAKLIISGLNKTFGLEIPKIDHSLSLYVVIGCIVCGIVHSLIADKLQKKEESAEA